MSLIWLAAASLGCLPSKTAGQQSPLRLVCVHVCAWLCRYGWGRNADKLELPKGVGFSVGKGSAVKWIVMQVHYLKEKPVGDNAGVRLR